MRPSLVELRGRCIFRFNLHPPHRGSGGCASIDVLLPSTPDPCMLLLLLLVVASHLLLSVMESPGLREGPVAEELSRERGGEGRGP